MRNILSKFFIIIGSLLIISAICLTIYNYYEGWRADQASQDIIQKLEKDRNEHGKSEKQDDTTESELYKLYPEMEMPAVEIDGYRYIAVLEIPSLNIKLPVMEEWDYSRLKISPCRYFGSAYTHDMVIAGHNYAKHFSPIKSMDEGDDIFLADMDGNRFHYKVIYGEVINPMNVSDMIKKENGESWDLTLFTCTTGGGARYTVRCSLVE